MAAMKTRALAVVVLVMGLASEVARADCDECKDLCRLMDEYQQREMGIKLWSLFATSTTTPQERSERARRLNGKSVHDRVGQMLAMWNKFRKYPCALLGSGPGVVTDLETTLDDNPRGQPHCTVVRSWGDAAGKVIRQEKLEGDVLDGYHRDTGCKAISDATIEHEKVHQQDCEQAYANHAEASLGDPHVLAESELKAWTKHKELVADKIRQIIRDKGCGWQPTFLGDALPSPVQVQNMEKRGWKAVNALWPGGPSAGWGP